jgi:hypothetical protein
MRATNCSSGLYYFILWQSAISKHHLYTYYVSSGNSNTLVLDLYQLLGKDVVGRNICVHALDMKWI